MILIFLIFLTIMMGVRQRLYATTAHTKNIKRHLEIIIKTKTASSRERGEFFGEAGIDFLCTSIELLRRLQEFSDYAVCCVCLALITPSEILNVFSLLFASPPTS